MGGSTGGAHRDPTHCSWWETLLYIGCAATSLQSKPEQQSHVSTRLLIYPAEGVKVLTAAHTHRSGAAVQKSRLLSTSGAVELLASATLLLQLGADHKTWGERGGLA